MSILLSLNSSGVPTQPTHNFTISYEHLILDDRYDWECALIRSDLWYSYYNISSIKENNTFNYSPDNGVTTHTITIPDGVYNIIDIQTYMEGEMFTNGDYTTETDNSITYHIRFMPNFNTLRVDIEIDNPVGGPYILYLNTSSFYSLIGHTSTTYTGPGTFTGPNLADITDGVNSILIRCSIIESSYSNNIRAPNIYSFIPSVPPGSVITLDIQRPIYLRIPPMTRDVREITMSLTDQDGNLLDFNGEEASYLLHLRIRKPIAPPK